MSNFNEWNHEEFKLCNNKLEQRVYSSKLIGKNNRFVLHGGGNTSLKDVFKNKYNEDVEIIWMKASGFDLSKMGSEGYTPLELSKVKRLASLSNLADRDMVNELLCSRVNSQSAPPSIESIVHALIPYDFIDHTHADAVLTISNLHNGASLLKQLYGNDVLFLPYVKPGFVLAQQFKALLDNTDITKFKGIILEHHGVFTFSDDAFTSYSNMCDLVNLAEDYLRTHAPILTNSKPEDASPIMVAKLRHEISKSINFPVISLPSTPCPTEDARDLYNMSCAGTLTPEHVIHNKPFPAFIDDDINESLQSFRALYQTYLDDNLSSDKISMPAYPHWGIFKSGQVRSFGPTADRAKVSSDVAFANIRALQHAKILGNWQGLTWEQLCDIEYWTLEQDKLKRKSKSQQFTGKIAVVTGAASGIGFACAQQLHHEGAVVIGLDIDPNIKNKMNKLGFESIIVDLLNEEKTKEALEQVVLMYGGIDIVISNAGIFNAGSNIEDLSQDVWQKTLNMNLTSHQFLLKHSIPFLKLGIDPSFIFVGSRNTLAPGAGASAYSVSKAGQNQLMRVAALELAKFGIRVNIIHPDAVFDTALWTKEALETSAKRYGITIDEYKRKNILHVDITSNDVAKVASLLASHNFSKTTGQQISVDGGNDRVI